MKFNAKIAVAGCGYWGKNLVRNFHEIGCLDAVYDVNENLSRKFSEKYKVRNISWRSILSDNSIEGIAIAAPAPIHYKLVSEALNAGKNVFIEKPITLNIKEAEELIKQANKSNLVLMVGHLLHYHPAFSMVKKLVSDGLIGKLIHIYSNRLSFGKIRTEENVLWSFAPHDISMILGITAKEPNHINANGFSHITKGIIDFSHIHMSFEGNISAHIFVSWLNPFKEQKLTVIGEKGMIIFDDTLPDEQKIAYFKNCVQVKNGVPQLNKAEANYIKYEAKEPLKEECRHFVKCIRNKETPMTDGEEGLRVLKVLNKAQNCIDKNF
jgi:predicted dehydrogenase